MSRRQSLATTWGQQGKGCTWDGVFLRPAPSAVPSISPRCCGPLPALSKPFELGHRERRPGTGFPPTSPFFFHAVRSETFLSGYSLLGLGRLLPDKTQGKWGDWFGIFSPVSCPFELRKGQLQLSPAERFPRVTSQAFWVCRWFAKKSWVSTGAAARSVVVTVVGFLVLSLFPPSQTRYVIIRTGEV